jgi:hypothetical protein
MKIQVGYSNHNTHAVIMQTREDLDSNLGFGDRRGKHQPYLSQLLPPKSNQKLPDFVSHKNQM